MTDADVDGSHIRTLLLTFFYREMKVLIDEGFLYIAQPPLYRIKKGKTNLYLKDDNELENFIIEDVINNSVLNLSNGEQISGQDLFEIYKKSLSISKFLDLVCDNNSGLYKVLEQAAISGILNNKTFNSQKKINESIDYVVKRLNFLENEFEKGWTAKTDKKHNLIFSRLIRDVNEKFTIYSEDINLLKYDGIDKMANFLQDIFLTSPELKWNDEAFKFSGPSELAEKMINIGKKGLIFQRYKGLGEMNPDQLWETTLDPQYRSLLRVSVEQAHDASEVFSDLMGDDVEKRKEFIQNNAKKVANLDV